MARDASAFDISTKPKPRGRPVSRSVIKETFSTVPCFENRAVTASSVAVKGRLPTYSLVTREYSRMDGCAGKLRLALWFVKLTRVRGCPEKESAGWRIAGTTDKPKDYEPRPDYRVSCDCAALFGARRTH